MVYLLLVVFELVLDAVDFDLEHVVFGLLGLKELDEICSTG